ncbi:hypothetical protein, partial [Muribaculum intestinale]
HWKCLKSRTINSALNEDAKNVCGALNICTKSLRIVKSHAPALAVCGMVLPECRKITKFAGSKERVAFVVCPLLRNARSVNIIYHIV